MTRYEKHATIGFFFSDTKHCWLVGTLLRKDKSSTYVKVTEVNPVYKFCVNVGNDYSWETIWTKEGAKIGDSFR